VFRNVGIKFRRRGITQKKTYSIHNTAKVWNEEDSKFYGRVWTEFLCNIYINFVLGGLTTGQTLPCYLLKVSEICDRYQQKVERLYQAIVVEWHERGLCRRILRIRTTKNAGREEQRFWIEARTTYDTLSLEISIPVIWPYGWMRSQCYPSQFPRWSKEEMFAFCSL
jgi:hypothetical protein